MGAKTIILNYIHAVTNICILLGFECDNYCVFCDEFMIEVYFSVMQPLWHTQKRNSNFSHFIAFLDLYNHKY